MLLLIWKNALILLSIIYLKSCVGCSCLLIILRVKKKKEDQKRIKILSLRLKIGKVFKENCL